MEIKRVYLENFGKFKQKTVKMSPGLNIVYGKNGSGKSTIYHFLESMLFGMERGRGRAALCDTFKTYEPFEHPSYYQGEVEFSSGNRRFILKRNFNPQSKENQFFCLDDNEKLSVEDGDLEAILGGINRGIFKETGAVPQGEIKTGDTLLRELKSYATSYYLVGNGDLNPVAAEEMLSCQQKELRKEEQKKEQSRLEQKESLEHELSYRWRDMHRCENDLLQVEEELDVKKKEAKQHQIQEEKNQVLRVQPFVVTTLIFCIIVSFLLLPRSWNYMVSIVLTLLGGIYVWNRIKDKQRFSPEEIGLLQEESLEKRIEKLQWERDKLAQEWQEKKVEYENLQEALKEMEEHLEDISVNPVYEALEIAKNRIKDLSVMMQKQVGEGLNKRASEILQELTAGEWDCLYVDETMGISLLQGTRRVEEFQLSKGTMELVYFSIRMAAQEILLEEDMPVLLDDSFVYMDDDKVEHILRWLINNRHQIILFTCQEREMELVRLHNWACHVTIL